MQTAIFVICSICSFIPKLQFATPPASYAAIVFLKDSYLVETQFYARTTDAQRGNSPARPKIQSQIFRYSRSIFCLPHRPNFSDFFDFCLHWVSVVRGFMYWLIGKLFIGCFRERQTLNIQRRTCNPKSVLGLQMA